MDAFQRFALLATAWCGVSVCAAQEPTLAPPQTPDSEDVAALLGANVPAELPEWNDEPTEQPTARPAVDRWQPRRSGPVAHSGTQASDPVASDSVASDLVASELVAEPLSEPDKNREPQPTDAGMPEADEIAGLLAEPASGSQLADAARPAAPTSRKLTLEQLERAATGPPTHHRLTRLLQLAEQVGAEQQRWPKARRTRLQRLRAWATLSRGRLRAAEGDTVGALEDYREACRLDPESTEATHSYALALADLGRRGEALAQLDLVIAKRPGFLDARHNRAALLLQEGDAAGALADCDHAIAAAPPLGASGDHQTLSLLALRATAYRRLGRLNDALADLNELLRERPDDAASLTERAGALAELGEYAEARRDYFAALHADPHAGEAYRGLTWLLACDPLPENRDAQMAMESARRARVLLGKNAATMEAAAVASAALGRHDTAARLQSRVVRLAGDGASRAVRLAAYERGDDWRLPAATGRIADGRVIPATHSAEQEAE